MLLAPEVSATRAHNRAADGDADVTLDGSPVRVRVIRAREDLEIARQTRLVLA
jgi:acetate kinase